MEHLGQLTWIQLVFGVLGTLGVGQVATDIFDETRDTIAKRVEKVPPPPGYGDFWVDEVVARTPGGEWIGRFEQIIFFASLLTHWGIAASWLAFKLASKWKSWTTTWQATRPPRAADDRAAFARAHLARTGMDHRLFTLGTAGNIVAGLAGLLVVRFFAGV